MKNLVIPRCGGSLQKNKFFTVLNESRTNNFVTICGGNFSSKPAGQIQDKTQNHTRVQGHQIRSPSI